MDAKKIQQIIDSNHYQDSRILKLNANYMFDEVELVHEDTKEESVLLYFSGCYKVHFDHDNNYDKLKSMKEMSTSQHLYFIQNIKIGEIMVNRNPFYTCKIESWPLDFEIWFKDISISKIKASDLV